MVSWTSMITEYAQHGRAKKALVVFEGMQKQNLEMNAITFTGVISAGTHAGLVDKAQHYFNGMINGHQIKPTMKHYSNIELGKLAAEKIISLEPQNSEACHIIQYVCCSRKLVRGVQFEKTEA